MWMSDRPQTQQRLAADLAALVEILPDTNGKIALSIISAAPVPQIVVVR